MPEWFLTLASQAPQGLLVTLSIAAGSILLTFLVGVPLGVLAGWSRIAARLVRLYVEFSRAIPVVVTVFFAFFVLPLIGIYLDPIMTVIAGLTIWGSSNLAEIVRGAIQSIPKAQTEAGLSLGLDRKRIMWLIVLPQAARRMLPSSVGVIAILVQATALASAVGVQDFLKTASGTIDLLTFETGESHAFEVYATVMAVFFLICFPITLLSRRLEKRLAL